MSNFHQVFLVGKILWVSQRIFLLKKYYEMRKNQIFTFFMMKLLSAFFISA